MKLRGVGLLAAGFALAARADDVPRRGLVDFQALALAEGPQLDEPQAKVEWAKAREGFAAAQAMPMGTVETLVAPLPGAEGNPMNGRTNWDSWGVFSASKLEIVQPIYTFGALGAARDAAKAGRQAEERLLDRERWTLRTQIAELYYQYQLAFDLGDLATNTLADLNKALDRAQKTSARDADKLRAYIGEADARRLEAEKALAQIKVGMAWRTGRYGQEVPRWDRANLVARDFALQDLAVYQKLARENRPEVQALELDVTARDALVNVETGLRLPTLFAAGRVQYTHNNVRDDQTSPFAYDPTNDLSGGVALGLRWNLGLFEKNAKVGQARAEALMARGRARLYGAGLQAEVEKNYLDVKTALDTLKVRTEAAAASKRVFRDLIVAYTLGTTNDAKSLFEALGQHVLMEKSRFEAIFQQNLSIAKLEQVVGKAL